MKQGLLFQEYLEPQKLKEGKGKCPVCERGLKAYCKSLDKRLVELLREIGDGTKTGVFNPRDVFKGDHHKINDFQKLKYWELIEKTKKSGFWKITERGYDFLNGRIQLPKRVWVFNSKVVLKEDERVDINVADPRWQEGKPDYSMDYVPVHLKKPKFIEKDGTMVAVYE